MIVQGLNEIQRRCGFLPVGELKALAARLEQPLHRIHEVASFYPSYRLQEPPTVQAFVCRDMACHIGGGPELHEKLSALAHEIGGGRVCVHGVSCLGQCDFAPAALVSAPASSHHDLVYRGLSDAQWRERLRTAAAREPLPVQRATREPAGWQIDVYEGKPGYEVIKKFIADRDADAILKQLELAKLVGMGGAGFPTHLKWAAVRKEKADKKYIVCNADESEPGTFKDRELLRRTPHLVIEGLVLAGLVTGASRGFVYIRHEYEEELQAMQDAIARAEQMGVCGEDILGSGIRFTVELFVSPGGYVQGEESALLEAMEDRRGQPRNKPPFPTVAGLFSRPTVINNVETLSWVPAIMLKGGQWYRDQGINGATGLRFVSISGAVNKPGVYEVPFGQTVRDLVMGLAGGMSGGQQLKAIATSGPSGGFLPAKIPAADLPEAFKAKLPRNTTAFDILDLKLDPASLRALGGMLGAAFVVYGSKACMLDNALNCVEFYRNESCGKCVPCRVGSEKLVEMIGEVTAGKMAKGRTNGHAKQLLDTIDQLAQTMFMTSICGLGQVAANPMTTVIKYFREELEQHLVYGRCPAGVCEGLS